MPQLGEERHGATESVRWDGSRWQPIPQPSSSSSPVSTLLSYIPGLRDVANLPSNLVKGAQAIPDVARGLIHNPGATTQGFVQGASDAATPDRVGLLALLTGGATLPAAAAAMGGESLAKAGQVASGSPNAPKSFPSAALDVAEAGAVPAIPAGINRGVRAVRAVAPNVSGGGVTGALLGGYEGYKRGGVLGALEGGATGYFLGNKASKLGKIIDSLGEKEGAPNVSVTDEGAPPSNVIDQEPAQLRPARFSTEVPTQPEGGWGASGAGDVTPKPSAPQPGRPISDAEQFNINRSAPYGEGALIPQALPTELRSMSLQGLEDAGNTSTARPYDVDYMAATGEKYMPESSVVESSAEPQAEPSASDVDSLLGDLSSRLEGVPSAKPQLPSSWQQLASPSDSGVRLNAPAPTSAPPPSLTALDAIDRQFGPGAVDSAGRPYQSTSGYRGANNLLYDPQTPTDYLREQFREATDPAEQDWLGKALRQRLRVGTSQLNLTGAPQ